jgi:hypothetical protein
MLAALVSFTLSKACGHFLSLLISFSSFYLDASTSRTVEFDTENAVVVSFASSLSSGTNIIIDFFWLVLSALSVMNICRSGFLLLFCYVQQLRCLKSLRLLLCFLL